MGIIQVPGRLSGRTYNIEIEGDSPTAAEQERIRAGVEERERRFVQRYEATMGAPLAVPDDGTAIGRGFERGKAGAKSVLGTTVETIGQQVGLPSIAEYGRGMEEAAAQRQFQLSLSQPAPTTRQDVAAAEGFFPTIGAGLSYAGELAGEQIPQFGVGLAGGAAGAVAGGVTAGVPGAIAGFGVGSGLVEAPMLFGANVQRQEEEVAAGRKDAVDLTDALGATVGQSALTSVTNALAGAGVFLRPGAKLFTRAVSGAAVGGTTEALNEVGQQMLERQQAGLPVDSEDAIQEYIDAGVAGGVLGFGAGGLGGAVGGRRTAGEPGEAPEEAPEATGEVPSPNIATSPADLSAAAAEVAGETEVDVEEARANAVFTYAEQRAAALRNGASEPEAQKIAAEATLEYVADLPPATQSGLSDLVGTLAKEASPARGVPADMRPELPDSAYASEFGAATQQELFGAPPAPAVAPQPAVELSEPESEADAFERAAAQSAAEARTAATMVEAPEPKPEQVLTDDLVTQLGVGPAKSASLRKLVGKPVQDAKVIKALDSWAQNPKAKPEQKALASSLITGQPVQGDLFVAPGPEVAPLAAEPEVSDVTQTAEAQPEEVGAGVPSGGQSVEGLGQPTSVVQAAEEPTAPTEGGLGDNLSVPLDTATAAGAEQPALTSAPLGTPPSLTRPVVPLYRMGPGIRPTPPLPKTNADLEMDKVLADRYAAVTPPNVKRGAQLLNEAGAKLGVKDPLLAADKRLVVSLLATSDAAMSPQGVAAKLYFSKVARPIDAILMVVDDLTAPYGKYRAEPGTPDYQREFMQGTGRDAAKQALEFIRTRMSPAAQAEVDFRIALSEQQNKNQETWLADSDRVELARTKRKQARTDATEAAKESGYISEAMPSADPLAALDRTLHYSVKMALDAGDLKGALQALSTTTNNADLAALAARFADMTGTTRIKVLYPGDPAKNIGGNRGIYWASAGGLDPEQENIIYLNGQTGMDAHVLMHEMAHAVTATLSFTQPNHPVIKQLEALLKSVRDKANPPNLRGEYPDEFYGLTDLREFMAEAYGRIAFGPNDNGLRALMKRTVFTDYSSATVEMPLTNYERFKEIIGNFFRSLIGRPSKAYLRRTKREATETRETGLDRFHRLMDGLLSDAPQVLPDSVFQKAISNPMVGRTAINNALQVAPVWDAAGRAKMANMMQASIPQGVRSALLGLLHLDWFDDLAGKYFPQIKELKRIDDERRGAIVADIERAKPVLTDLEDYAVKSPEMMSKLMAIQGRATVEQVDPTQPVSKYSGDKDKTRVWHELNRELATSDSTGKMRGLYKKVRNMYLGHRKGIEDALKERIKDISDDVAVQNQLFSRLMAKLDEEGVLDPYFALMRKGDYWLAYTAEDTTAEPELDATTGKLKRPPTKYVQAFESIWDRDAFRNKLMAAKDADGNPLASEFEEFPRPEPGVQAGTVPTAFVQGAINIVNSTAPQGADAEARARADAAAKAIEDMFVRFTPEHSLMKSFTKRKGTRGFIGDITPLGVVDRPLDMVQALAEKSSTLAYQLANMKYGTRIQRLRNSANTTERNLQESTALTAAEKAAVRAYATEFDLRADFAQSPNVGQMAQAVRGVTFGMTLGFSIAGAANNLFQIPMIGTTELGGRYGMGASVKALGFAATLLKNAGKTSKTLSYGAEGMETRELSTVDNFGSVANYFEPGEDGKLKLRTDKKMSAKLRARIADLDVLVEVLSANGMLANSMAQEMLEAESGLLQKINKWSGFLMHHAERFNRQTMAIAAYNLELGKATGGAKGPISYETKLAAAKKALEITERVNGSIGASTAPRLAQGSVGSVVFMFKRFGLHMARYILSTANEAVRGKDPVERKIARYQITGMLGTTALFAGVQGLPFFGELMSLINLFFTDDDEEPAEVLLEKFLQEPFYHGAINYLTGAEVASRISLSGLIFRENMIEKDQSIMYDLFEMLGGPAVGVFMNAERGVDLISQGEFYRGIEAMLPSAIKSVMKAGRFGTEGATTLRDDEVVPLSYGDIALQFVGYTPGAFARTQERVSGAKRIDEAIRTKKRKLYRKYYLAYLDKDFEEMRSVMQDMQEFSRENPEEAITGASLTQSLKSNLQRSNEMLGGVSFTGSGRARAQESFDEYDDDISIWSN